MACLPAAYEVSCRIRTGSPRKLLAFIHPGRWQAVVLVPPLLGAEDLAGKPPAMWRRQECLPRPEGSQPLLVAEDGGQPLRWTARRLSPPSLAPTAPARSDAAPSALRSRHKNNGHNGSCFVPRAFSFTLHRKDAGPRADVEANRSRRRRWILNRHLQLRHVLARLGDERLRRRPNAGMTDPPDHRPRYSGKDWHHRHRSRAPTPSPPETRCP